MFIRHAFVVLELSIYSYSHKFFFKHVFDISGRLVKAWADKVFEKGEHRINWNAENMVAGIYIVKMETAGFSENKKLVVVK